MAFFRAAKVNAMKKVKIMLMIGTRDRMMTIKIIIEFLKNRALILPTISDSSTNSSFYPSMQFTSLL